MNASARIIDNNSCLFSVWAPERENIVLHIVHPSEQKIRMKKVEDGYFSSKVSGIIGGCRYFYRLDDKDIPDPASHFQPEGVHGPSQVVNHDAFRWTDNSWRGIPQRDLIMYEIHVGTFTEEGTFDAIIPLLDEISETGINALELMPVCQFPGSRNWGYDGVFPYSVQNSYGGPEGLKRLVDASHSKGIAVYLDVVYNHLGPEGNYLSLFGPYLTDKYRVPWGQAINLDDAWCDGVREYFSCNPCHWFGNYHIDGLRADAIHMIFDSSAINFWELTKQKIKQMEDKMGRRFHLIAESDFNSPRVVKPLALGGFEFDAQWLDDFHHTLYALLDCDGKSRYEDFGSIEQLARAYTDGFVHAGEHVKFRKRKHGASSAGIPGEKFVVFNQNHDQVGNRVTGERLSVLVGLDKLKIAAAAMLLSPYIPLIFMGEEYGEDNPFLYFISHSDKDLIKAVREGRKKEFNDHKWEVEPPDPVDESTFSNSKINWQKRYSGSYSFILDWHRQLISLRHSLPALKNTSRNGIFVYVIDNLGFILLRRSEDEKEHILCFFNLSEEKKTFIIPTQSGSWIKILDSGDAAPQEIRAGKNLDTNPLTVVIYCNK